MAGYVMKMSILVSNINLRGLKDFLLKSATKHMHARYQTFKMRTTSLFFLIFILTSNNSFCQQIIGNEYSQIENECYRDILMSLIYDNITWTSHYLPPVPPIPLKAIDSPTKKDSLDFEKKMNRYLEGKELQYRKMTVFFTDSLYSVDEFNFSKTDTCKNNLMNLNNIKNIDHQSYIQIIQQNNYEYISSDKADIKIKLGRIHFGENYTEGYLMFVIEDMFGFETTKCYAVKFNSSKWKIYE
ncbi:MAG: hypothetical protein KKB74_12445 [Bacteroidetes bacterium]|nr:hypothetical protein [Bacteroidota bacterium]